MVSIPFNSLVVTTNLLSTQAKALLVASCARSQNPKVSTSWGLLSIYRSFGCTVIAKSLAA
jgi:hypothetical protein